MGGLSLPLWVRHAHGSFDRRHCALYEARHRTANRVEVLAAAGDCIREPIRREAPLNRHDPRLACEHCAEIDARRFTGDFAVADHTQHGGVLGDVTPLQIGGPRDGFSAQRAGLTLGLVPWPALRRGAAGAAFDALVPGSIAAGRTASFAPKRQLTT